MLVALVVTVVRSSDVWPKVTLSILIVIVGMGAARPTTWGIPAFLIAIFANVILGFLALWTIGTLLLIAAFLLSLGAAEAWSARRVSGGGAR